MIQDQCGIYGFRFKNAIPTCWLHIFIFPWSTLIKWCIERIMRVILHLTTKNAKAPYWNSTNWRTHFSSISFLWICIQKIFLFFSISSCVARFVRAKFCCFPYYVDFSAAAAAIYPWKRQTRAIFCAMIVLNGPELICNCKYTYHYVYFISHFPTWLLTWFTTKERTNDRSEPFIYLCISTTTSLNPFIVLFTRVSCAYVFVLWNVQKGKTREFQLFVFAILRVSSLYISSTSAFRLVSLFVLLLLLVAFRCVVSRSSLALLSLLLGGICKCVCAVWAFAYTIKANIKIIQKCRIKEITE